MQLPGGIYNDAEVHRAFAFAPITGVIELAMAESAVANGSLAERITGTLVAALAHVGGKSLDWGSVHRMSVGDRQFLMRRLAAHLELDQQWLTVRCGKCDAPFDFFVQQSALPVKPAGAGYPFAEVTTRSGKHRFRVPTGEDQAAVHHIVDEAEAVRVLAGRLIDYVGNEPPEIDDDDLFAIEKAVENVAPEITTEIEAACPECNNANRVQLDPYALMMSTADTLFAEVHQVARAYHWSEAEILALPRARRKIYLGMIDADRGMTQ